MKIDLNSTYEREIENNPMNHVKFYVTLALVLISTTFFAGIRPAAQILTQNLKYSTELETIKTDMDIKLQKTDEGYIYLTTKQEQLEKLNHAMPAKPEIDDLLKEFVLTTSSTGFIVVRLRQVENSIGEIPITVEMTGEMEKLPELIKAVETMNRFIAIEEMSTDDDNGRIIFRLQIKTYTI